MNATMDLVFYAVLVTWFVTTLYWQLELHKQHQRVKALEAELAGRPTLKEIEGLRCAVDTILKRA